MSNHELIRLNADQTPMKAIYPVIENHPVSKLNGEIDYDGLVLNRLEYGFFGLLRARLIALWAAKEISSSQLGKMLAAVSEGNLNTTSFSDESNAEANDDNIIEMFNNLKDVNEYLQNCDVTWIKPYTEPDGYANNVMCKQFGAHLLNGVSQLKKETVKILSEEQLDSYVVLAEFLLESPYGVGIT